jgi:TonB family protein
MPRTLYLIPVLGLALICVVRSGRGQQAANPAATTAPTPIRISAGVMAGRRISGDMPVYPADAGAGQVQGAVVLQALISSQGRVENLRVITGPPMLQSAAIDAVRTWIYKPYLLNGEPVAVQTQINVIFSLASDLPAAAPGAQSTQAAGANGTAGAESATPPPPAHPITTEQVHEMMQLTGAINLTKQMLDDMMPTLRQSMPPYMPPDVLDDFEKTLLGSDFEAMMVRTYQAHLSAEDAAEIIAFYRTSAGQHMLAAMPQIAKDSQAAGQQLGEQVMVEVLQRHRAEIEAAKEKYRMQHPWTAPKD